MFSTIKNTFEINNTSRLLTLKQDLLHIKMINGESITSYFVRISELKDQLATIRSQVDDKELCIMALKGLPLSWETFICSLSSPPDLPKFEQHKNECTQEESRLILRGISLNRGGDIQALQINTSNKGKKRKFKRKRKEFNKTYKKRDWSKVECYKCDKFDHTHNIFPERKTIQATLTKVKNEKDEKLAF